MIEHWSLEARIRLWYARLRSRLVAWACNITGGHHWSGTLTTQLPTTGDFVELQAIARCLRCRQVMVRRLAVSNRMIASATMEYARDQLGREFMRDLAHQAIPIYTSFADWMHDAWQRGLRP